MLFNDAKDAEPQDTDFSELLDYHRALIHDVQVKYGDGIFPWFPFHFSGLKGNTLNFKYYKEYGEWIIPISWNDWDIQKEWGFHD